MIISRYGVKLIRVRREHLELIRYWRNTNKIRMVMEYQEFITQRMQRQWFNSLNFFSDFYFVIEFQENLVGLIHTSKVDWKNKTAQSGLFIWEDTCLGSPVPIMASVNLLDAFFDFFNLDSFEAKVKHDNFVALTYNKFLGFEEIKEEERKEFIHITLSNRDYAKNSAIIKNHFDDTDKSKLRIQLSNEDLEKFENAGIALKLHERTFELEMLS